MQGFKIHSLVTEKSQNKHSVTHKHLHLYYLRDFLIHNAAIVLARTISSDKMKTKVSSYELPW